MKTLIMALGAVTTLTACQIGGGAAVDPAQRVTSHASLAASVGENFIWDCALTEQAGNFPRQFILQRQTINQRSYVMLLAAGAPRPQRVEVTEQDFARRFILPDTSKILISSSGQAFAIDPQGRAVSGDGIGQCRKGSQPI